jgi:hydrogenase-4 component B
MIGIGTVSGIAGVLHALAQHDLKRLLAYHSVENIGIIALGLGVGLLGQSQRNSEIAFLGYAGALLHVLNHGLFKGLLFQCAGSVLHETGTRDIESLGGLARTMPITAALFLTGSVAICGLPPLNGFVSEWLIYVGAFGASSALPTRLGALALVTVPALALIGGLAAACFVKAYGVVFLGEPRTSAARSAHEPGVSMRVAMLVGAGLCAAIGFFPTGALRLVALPAGSLLGLSPAEMPVLPALTAIAKVGAALLIAIAALALLRRALLRHREVATALTWGCGYSAPSPRMQYTAASFAEPVLEPFRPALQVLAVQEGPDGPFPETARFEEHLGDKAGERLLIPAIRGIVNVLLRFRVVQQGRVHLYLVYMLVTLVALLVWQLRGVR